MIYSSFLPPISTLRPAFVSVSPESVNPVPCRFHFQNTQLIAHAHASNFLLLEITVTGNDHSARPGLATALSWRSHHYFVHGRNNDECSYRRGEQRYYYDVVCLLRDRRRRWHQIEEMHIMPSRTILQHQMSEGSLAKAQKSMQEAGGWITWWNFIQATWKQSLWGLPNLLFAAADCSITINFVFML